MAVICFSKDFEWVIKEFKSLIQLYLGGGLLGICQQRNQFQCSQSQFNLLGLGFRERWKNTCSTALFLLEWCQAVILEVTEVIIYFSLASKKFPLVISLNREATRGPLYAYFETMFIEFKGEGGKEGGGYGRGERAPRLIFHSSLSREITTMSQDMDITYSSTLLG